MPPGSFGPFRVLHQIGTGVLGPVFRTYEPARDRLVAVKAFRLDFTPEQARAFADELQRVAAAGLDHPSIVRPIAGGVEGTTAYAASEYVAAESLDIAMRHYAPAAIDTVLPFITQLAGAIDFARAAGVGHGALHPRDVFVTPEEARATGFGVVQALETLGMRAPVRRPYSAPERVASGAWDIRADVYSLAAIAYELLTGRRPVGADVGDLGQVAGAHRDAVAASLSRALAGDPDERYASALAFAAALAVSSRGERPTGAIEEVRRVAEEAVPPRTLVVEPEEPTLAEPYAELAEDVAIERDEDLADIQLKEEETLLQERAEEAPATAAAAEAASAVSEEAPDALEQGPVAWADERPLGEPAKTLHEAPEAPREPAEVPLEHAARSESRTLDPLFDFEDTSEAGIPEVQHPMVGEFARREPEPSEPREPREPRERRGPLDSEDSRPSPVRPRPVLLPVALTLLLGLFVGFLAGYLVGARDRGETAGEIAAGSPGSPGSPGSGSLSSSGSPGSAGSGAPGSARQRTEPTAPALPEARAPEEPRAPRASAPTAAVPAAQSERGRLVVRSNPPGASVFLNGRRRGSTPLALRELVPGAYALRLTRSGFRDDVRRVSVTAGAVRDVTIRLERVPATPQRAAPAGAYVGSIYVDSRPRGARVLLDGRQIGVTPLQVGDIRAGAHVVRLELADHRPWSTSVRVVAGEVVRVTGSLERQR